ncbi:MAG: hypothetical protein ACOYT4_01220 [Nanoarchaeota archaeon]
MIAIIRIHGKVKLKKDLEETLFRLNIRKKLSCTLIDEKDKIKMGMLNASKNFVAYGKISDEFMKKLIEKRGKTLDGKKVNPKDVDKIAEELKKGNWKIKKFFGLHPPIGGFKKSTKLHAPRGVLGKHEDVSKLMEKML